LEFGFWNLDFTLLGPWILEFGTSLEFGFWNLEFTLLGPWILELGPSLDFGFWNLEFGFWNLEFFSLLSFYFLLSIPLPPIPLIQPPHPFLDINFVVPAKLVKFGGIGEFTHGAVGFGGVEVKVTAEPNGAFD